MKTVILGDTHFGGGYSLGRADSKKHVSTRLLDFSKTFNYVIDFMINNDVKNFIITGDIFEHRRPQAFELNVFAQKIEKLRELNINTHIVVGNHDLIRGHNSTTLDVFKSLKLPMINIYRDISSYSYDNKINFIFLPFRSRQMIDSATNEDAALKTKNKIKHQIMSFTNNAPIVLVGHLMLEDKKFGKTIVDTSPSEVVLPLDMFDGIDAVVMGHVHPHMIVQRKNPLISYVGSMDCANFGEAKVDKCFLYINEEDGKIKFNFERLPVRELHDILIDESKTKNGMQATENVLSYLREYSKNNIMKDSVVRLTIHINNASLFDLNRENIKAFLYKTLDINYCVGISPCIIAERQMRKSNITERNGPLDAFDEYLKFEEDIDIREKMREIGTTIIREHRE